jgi:hypothetical protein
MQYYDNDKNNLIRNRGWFSKNKNISKYLMPRANMEDSN